MALAEVTVQAAGTGTIYHFYGDVGATHAVVFGLDILDDAAAAEQVAWMDDGDEVVAGVTLLANVISGTMLAVPLACLQTLP